MRDMAALAKSKLEALTSAVTSDSRWRLEDELMFQVFGFTMYGYLFGVARIACFMDVEDIQRLATAQLTGLGVGPKYAEGMIQHAHKEFVQEGNTSLHKRLIGIGHSHFACENVTELVEAIFTNTQGIRESSR